MGARQVIALDRVEQRRRTAESLGAITMLPGDEALEYVKQQTSAEVPTAFWSW